MYRDKNNPLPEDVRKTYDNIKITKENAHLIAPILAELENEKNEAQRYNLYQSKNNVAKNIFIKV